MGLSAFLVDEGVKVVGAWLLSLALRDDYGRGYISLKGRFY